MPGPPSHPKSARMVWYAPTSAMYAAASAISAKHTRSPYIQGRAASAGPPETRAWTNPTRQARTATVSSRAEVRRIFGIWLRLEAGAAGTGPAGAGIVEPEARSAGKVDDGALEQGRARGIDRDLHWSRIHQGVLGPGALHEVQVVSEPVAAARHHRDAQQPAFDLRVSRAGEHRLGGAFGERETHREGSSGRKGREARGSGGVLLAERLELVVRNVRERLHAAGIELGSAAARDLQARLGERRRLAIRPVAGHRVQRIRDREDARAERDRLSPELVRISAAVPALLVREHDLRGGAEEVDGLQDAVAHLGMPPHLRPLCLGQRTRLEENAVRNADLADVVEERAAADVLDLVLGYAHPPGDGDGVAHHALGVIAGLVLASVERVHQRHQRVRIGLRDAFQRRGQLGGALAHPPREALVVAGTGGAELAPAPRALDGPHQL